MRKVLPAIIFALLIPCIAGAQIVNTNAGNVYGPSSTTSGRLAIFSGTSGKVLTDTGAASADSLTLAAAGSLTMTGRGVLTSPASATWQLGAADVDTAPVAQTLQLQGVLTGGTSDVAAANFTLVLPPGKGTGAGAALIIKTGASGSSGNTLNPLINGMVLNSDAKLTIAGRVRSNLGFDFNGSVGVTLTCTVMPTQMTIQGGIITSVTGGTCS